MKKYDFIEGSNHAKVLRATSLLALDLGYLVLPSLNKGIIIIIIISNSRLIVNGILIEVL